MRWRDGFCCSVPTQKRTNGPHMPAQWSEPMRLVMKTVVSSGIMLHLWVWFIYGFYLDRGVVGIRMFIHPPSAD